MRRLTILICTHNRAGLLYRTLTSLNAAARPPGWAVDVLVAVNACTDDTDVFLKTYCQQVARNNWLPLTWYAEPAPGKSHALNSARLRVRGDLVAFVDDDHRVDDGYLQAVCNAAERVPEADLFCGRIIPDWDGSEPAWVHDDGPYRIYPLPVPRFELGEVCREVTAEVAIPGGGNLFVRTPWLAHVGDFATNIGPIGHDLGGAEDRDWILRALALGARLWYVPDMVQYHYVDASRLTLPYVLRKAYKRTASIMRVDPDPGGAVVPRYLYRKLAEYGLQVLTALGQARRRFYLVRTAAALGEIAGCVQRRRQASAAGAGAGHAD